MHVVFGGICQLSASHGRMLQINSELVTQFFHFDSIRAQGAPWPCPDPQCCHTAQDPTSALHGHQPLPQQHRSRASAQLPAVLPIHGPHLVRRTRGSTSQLGLGPSPQKWLKPRLGLSKCPWLPAPGLRWGELQLPSSTLAILMGSPSPCSSPQPAPVKTHFSKETSLFQQCCWAKSPSFYLFSKSCGIRPHAVFWARLTLAQQDQPG